MATKDEKERELHLRAIDMLSRETGIVVAEIIPLYEMELEKLRKTARVNDFLTVLVSRRVKDVLKNGEVVGAE